MSDKMREEFEAWMLGTAKIVIGSTDPYPSGLERGYWRVWQASRESLVIELPDHCCYDLPGEAYPVIQDCREAIEAAGLKVKS